jgi:hypothetical protein
LTQDQLTVTKAIACVSASAIQHIGSCHCVT